MLIYYVLVIIGGEYMSVVLFTSVPESQLYYMHIDTYMEYCVFVLVGSTFNLEKSSEYHMIALNH